ncbi:TIM barrel protein [Sphingobium sp. DEHP117]|uniref:TIM barrel protein n=1 Tax=Sphingobium sp. DEHP117 TaxID=2993436 RepID=UPI0027D49743|nr:TIM barrel protein [Sphingobium sp. DEHP117]MDQ4419293.1 TIM barrel protein [Sphingobium sp. DEHP117]
MVLAPCIEWHFDQYTDLGERIRAAHAAGYEAAEFHLWRDKDIASIAAALADTGVRLTGFCADPRRSLVDPAQHDELFAAVRDSIAAAGRIGQPPIIIASGFVREGISLQEHFDTAVTALSRLARMAETEGATLVLEPLNDRIDHPGMYLVSTTLGLDLIEAVGSPALRLLYDVYHSTVMGEDMEAVLEGRMHLVRHVQVADFPGRNEPGTGTIDWPAKLSALKRMGYDGDIGLEYRPTLPIAESLARTRQALGL